MLLSNHSSFMFYDVTQFWTPTIETFLVSNNKTNLIMRKEPRKPIDQMSTLKDFGHNLLVLEEKEERIAPGTLLGTTHMYVLGAMDKTGAKRVELLLGLSRCHSLVGRIRGFG
ncbi:hypothetical protein AMTRI_Chr02g253750 [Amborella trichopoda]